MMCEVISSFVMQSKMALLRQAILHSPIRHPYCNAHKQIDFQKLRRGLSNQQTGLSKSAIPT